MHSVLFKTKYYVCISIDIDLKIVLWRTKQNKYLPLHHSNLIKLIHSFHQMIDINLYQSCQDMLLMLRIVLDYAVVL